MPDTTSPVPWLSAVLLGVALLTAAVSAQDPVVDETPPRADQWGERPVDQTSLPVNPPAFVCRPQAGATHYEWQTARAASFTIGVSQARTTYPVYCPPDALGTGKWYWRFRFGTGKGLSGWSRTREFTVPEDAPQFAMPDRPTLVGRLPTAHPRLFVRPEDLPKLRVRAQGEGKSTFATLLSRCEGYHASRPATTEPPRYPDGVVVGSQAWRTIWWSNRRATIAVLSAAADLAFVAAVLEGKDADRHGALAKELLLAVAKWDPRGSTGLKYNDEAGMPYAYWFARTYTFLHGRLTPEERKTCQDVMRVRGEDMYRWLAPRHLWQPFNSHANRGWHFLGEVGIAFFGEIEAAEEWVWFASRVFAAVYPVWGDADGGWHEGLAYWASYLGRFTWWADVQQAAFGVDAYRKPFFASVGDFPLYLQPPGTVGGGFGDLATTSGQPRSYGALLHRFAAVTGNRHWEWRAQKDGVPQEPGFIGWLRGGAAAVEPAPPTGLPTSKLFRGTGIAVLNQTLLDAADNVQVIFKSSPFGTQSHGYEAQNAFLLQAFGERLLIRSGRRDSYGSEHHRQWMWDTRSVNSITVDGRGQGRRSASARGRITGFATGPDFDYVVGEAGEAYADLDRFTRRILFVKPDYVVIHDTLSSDQPRTYQWWLHSIHEGERTGDQVRFTGKKASCLVRWLVPQGLVHTATDRCTPPPQPPIVLKQYHLSAATPTPQKEMTFVTVIRPFRTGAQVTLDARVEAIEGGHRVHLGSRPGNGASGGEPELTVDLLLDRTTAVRGDKRFDSSAPAEKPK